ncbi:hypothetical protein D3C72_1300690 [compost metagenome]
MVTNEGGTLACAVFRVLQAALPLQHCPAGEVVLRELREDRLEIDLAIAERTESPRTIDPVLVAAIHATAGTGVVLRILDVEHADAVVVAVDEAEVVHLLQQQMAGVVQDLRAGMLVHYIEEALEGSTVVQILTGVDFEAQVHAAGVERIQDGAPAAAEFGEGFLHQPGRALRPRIEIRPGQRAGERGVRGQPQALAGLGGQQQLLHRPGLAGDRIATLVRRRESVEQAVVGGMDGDQLPLQVGGQFGDLQAMSGQHAGDVVAVRLAVRRLGQIEQVGRAGRHL